MATTPQTNVTLAEFAEAVGYSVLAAECSAMSAPPVIASVLALCLRAVDEVGEQMEYVSLADDRAYCAERHGIVHLRWQHRRHPVNMLVETVQL